MQFFRSHILILFLLLLCFAFSIELNATHNRAGEITYQYVPGTQGRTFDFTITTYTRNCANCADRPSLEINYGDGTVEELARTQEVTQGLGFQIKKNVYEGRHTYSTIGSYRIFVEDPNRNQDILNISSGNINSVNVMFYIETRLTISPTLGANSSPVLTNPPIDNACVGSPYYHNPGAFDPDGDSLSYELVVCLQEDGEPIPSYVLPDQIQPGPNNNISIDPVSGTVTWDSPQLQGEYNIAILITEWRKTPSGTRAKIGSVLRDLQIDVGPCNNDPPDIEPLPDTCVLAGTTVNFDVNATDINNDMIDLTAFGETFELSSSPSVFSQNVDNPGFASGTFTWSTNCSHVRNAPYQVNFRAEDNHSQTSLTNYQSMNIRVVAPAPQNPEANPAGNFISLSWDESICDNATRYDIYRRNGFFGFIPDNCETGVPAYTGYSKIGQVQGVENTTYLDEYENITHGQEYCYMVVAVFQDSDGAESYASEEFCTELIRDIPVITHVSVGETDTDTGRDTIIWSMPTELDTLADTSAEYTYQVFRRTGTGNADEFVTSFGPNTSLGSLDTMYVDTGLNTEENPYTYKIHLLRDGELIGTTNNATSPFLTLEPNDNELFLELEMDVPWVNHEYEFYRWNENSEEFELIATTTEPFYRDTGLINQKDYCYYAKTFGDYTGDGYVSPIINYSQENCDAPWDFTPPCPPELDVDSECESLLDNMLFWTNPNNACEETDDVVSYNIYFAQFKTEDPDEMEFELIATVDEAEDTVYFHSQINSVSGCYVVTAIDSVPYSNESDFSNMVCVDNCPEYALPNVFTPNGDGYNDIFKAIKNRSIEEIELEVYNRWGQVVYKTSDPYFNWDGRHMGSGEMVSDGTYFYLCKVFTIRLEGIETEVLKGSIQVLESSNKNIID